MGKFDMAIQMLTEVETAVGAMMVGAVGVAGGAQDY